MHGGETEKLVLLPEARKRAVRLGRGAAIGAVAMACAFVEGVVEGLLVAVAVAAMILFGVGRLCLSRITVTADEVAVRGALLRRRRLRSRVAEAVRADVVQPQGPDIDTVYLLDSRRVRVLRVDGFLYGRRDITRLVKTLRVPCRRPGRPVTPAELARMYPTARLMPAAERRPFLAGIAIVGSATGLVVGALYLAVTLGAP